MKSEIQVPNDYNCEIYQEFFKLTKAVEGVDLDFHIGCADRRDAERLMMRMLDGYKMWILLSVERTSDV